MPIPFEATNSFCYRFARYEILPRIIALPEVQGGEKFRLVELIKKVVDETLTLEQQSLSYLRAKTGEPLTVIKTIKWYVPFLAKKTEQLVTLGEGIYRIPTAGDIDEAAAEDSALDDGELEVSESEGYVYAFSFPMLIEQKGAFPIKVGMTVNDVQQRVFSQCKGSATFDNPMVLGQWKVVRVGYVESAVHKMLADRKSVV